MMSKLLDFLKEHNVEITIEPNRDYTSLPKMIAYSKELETLEIDRSTEYKRGSMGYYDCNKEDECDANLKKVTNLEAKLKVAGMAVSKANDDHWFMINLIEKYSSDKESCLKDILERLKFRKPLYESTLEKIKAK